MTPHDAAADPQQIITDLERKLAESVAQQAAATEVLQIINGSGGDLKPVLDVMVTKAAELCDATGGGLYLVEGDKTVNYGGTTSRTSAAPSELMGVPLASILGPNPQDRPFVHVVDLKATKAYRNGVPFIVASVESDMRSWLGVPVINDGVIVAVFALFRKEVRPFSENQIRLLQSFAVQASIAMTNARLFNETKEALEQQAATAKILKVINSSPNDLTPVFDIILEKAHSLCDITTGSLELYEGDIARSVAVRGMNVRWEQYLRQGYKITETLRPAYMAVSHSHVIDMKKTVERFPDEPTLRAFVEIGGLRTFLGLTLAKDGKAFGRIIAARDEVRPFTDKQIALLQSFADQAVIAIENARLLTEQREALERQTATADILKVISSSVADTTPVFEQILDSCERLAAFNRMAIFLLGEDGQVHIGAYRGGEGDALKATFPQPLANTPMSLAFECQQARFFGDVLNNPDAPASLRIAASRVGSFSVLVAPLLWEGRGIGAFHVARDADATFSDREVALLKTFADQAAIAIQNARLFNETREALEQQKASADILSVISSSVADAQPVFDKILVSCKHLFGGDELDVLLVDEQGQLNIAAYIGDFHDVVAATFPAPVERTPAGRAIRECRVMHWPDLIDGNDVPGVLRKMAKLIGYRSMVFAPMLWEGRGIGAIGVARSTGPFKPKELAMLQTFADQAVIAIQNARLFDEVQAKTNYLSESLQQQTAVGEVLKTISRSTFDLQRVLDTLVETAARLCDTEMAFIMRREGEVYRAGAAVGYSEDYIEFLKNHPLTVDRGTITGRAVLERRTVQILDTATDPEYRLRESTSLAGQHTALCVPLMRENEPIGTIVLARQRVEAFTPKQIELVTTFADQAVIAIENVRLFDEVRQRTDDLSEYLQQQTATADVLKVISRSAFDLPGVLDTLVSSAARLCGDPRASIYLLRDGLLHLEAACNISADWIEYRRNHPMAPSPDTPSGRAALTGRVDHVPDLLEDPNFTRSDLIKLGDYRATLNVPLSRDGETVGVLSLARPEPGPFTQRQIDLVQTFADQAVIAIENVRLFDEVQAKTRDLTEALTYQTGSGNILKVIASSPTDVGPVLAAIAENAAELCDAYDAAVLLKVGDDLHFSAHHGSIPIGLERWPINRNWTAGRAFLDQKPVHIHDLRADENADFSDGRELSLRMGHRSILSVPLLRENESIGAIVLRRKEVHPFSDKQIALLQTFADQAVIAIGNVRLFEEVQSRTEDLRESLQFQTATSDVLKVISSSPDSLQPVLDVIVETSRHLCGTETSTIFLLNDDKFHIAVASGAMPEYLEFLRSNPIALDQAGSSTSRAAREKRTIHIPDIGADPEFGQGPMAVGQRRALLSVPLMREGVAIGVITMRQSHLTPFTGRQIEVVQTFADQAVIAISNVRLFEQVQERTRELSQSLDELRTAQDRLVQTEKLASLGQLTAGIAHEIKNPLNFVNNFSALSAELVDELNDTLKPAALEHKMRQEVDDLTQMLKGNLEKVVQHGKRADSIVKNMLLHSREGSGEHRPTDINALLDESLNLAYHGARAEKPSFNVMLTRDLDPEAGAVELYPQEITRALLNLISNGFYAATQRKSVEGETFEPVLIAATKNCGKTVEIRIRDNGNGIPDDVKAKIFNPFFTTKPSGEGTGLGLSMSHDIIVKQHGGSIDVETEPGLFTEFKIVLPRTSQR